jgi:hypothetical protein
MWFWLPDLCCQRRYCQQWGFDSLRYDSIWQNANERNLYSPSWQRVFVI